MAGSGFAVAYARSMQRLTTRATIVRWFAFYLDRYFARNFTAVRLSSSGSDPSAESGPVIVYTNHPSWWDPILFFLLGTIVFPGRGGRGSTEVVVIVEADSFEGTAEMGPRSVDVSGTRESGPEDE